MNPVWYFDLILLLIYACLTLCVRGSKFGECGNILSQLNLDKGVHQIDLFPSTGQACRCTEGGSSYWTLWSPCYPGGSCFEAKQHRTRKCRNGCYRILLRRCLRKPYGCNGKWGSWSNDYSCFSTSSFVTRTRFCYSKSGKLGAYCNASRDEFYQTQRIPCGNNVPGLAQNSTTTANGKIVPNPPGKTLLSGNTNNNSSWTSSSEGNLVIIILSVLVGVFLVALIFISIMFASLRKNILLNGGGKGRSTTDSTASATSYLTTLTEKELSSMGEGSQKYHHINAPRFRTSSNAKESPLVKMRNKEIVLSKHEDTQNTFKNSAPANVLKRRHDEEETEIVNKERNMTARTVPEDDPSKERGSGLFKKARDRRSDKTRLKEAIVIAASTPSIDDIRVSQKPKKEYFQSLPHIRTDEIAFQKRKSKNFRFSDGKEICNKSDDRKSRERTKSEEEIVFSGWDKSNESTPTTASSHTARPGVNDIKAAPKKHQRPASNTFLFSSKAFNSLQKSSKSSKALPKSAGFKLDYNMLMKKAAAANARGRGEIDGRRPDIAVTAHDDSGNYSHIDPNFLAYGSVLDAKPIEADAVSNASAYADVWDAQYTSKPISDNDEDDYSEVFDARSNAKRTTSISALSRQNRTLPGIASRSTVHESPSLPANHPTASQPRLGSPTKHKGLPIDSEFHESTLKEKLTAAANEPIYCAI